ncbi:MAG: outer membrane lipoprotein carrier protein LolA [Flavobacteriales bacterium]|nr:outer membrane lipoprotein carrier protein LolA [Flavobacteriales bacterium]MCB9168338.1 outer membrane lipoprotein carrier protein LolA [Flavobacteriales bacterium]
MRTTITLLALGLFAMNTLHAQDDPKSKAVMDRLIAKNKSYTSFEAEFTSRLQSTKDKLDVKQEGHVQVQGRKWHLTLDANTVISDGTTMWTYNKEANEVTINSTSEMDQELDPSRLLSMYETGFKSQFVGESTLPDGTVTQVVKLFPSDPAKRNYHTVVLTIDKNKVEPRSVVIMYKDGSEVTYTLRKFMPNPTLSDALFAFDKSRYPGVEVNDMR